MTKKRELFEAVKNAVDHNANLVITLKADCDGKIQIPIGESDKVAMDILAFLDREHGDLSVGQMEAAIHSAEWWLTTTVVL